MSSQGACLLLDGFAFVPIVKNGSSSMGHALAQEGAGEDNFLRRPALLDSHKLSVILRDPVDRFISTYNFIDWLGGTPDSVLDGAHTDELYMPQHWFLAGHAPLLVGRFPPSDFMGLGLTVPHFNKGQRPSRFKQHDTPALRRRIARVYAKDMELWNSLREPLSRSAPSLTTVE